MLSAAGSSRITFILSDYSNSDEILDVRPLLGISCITSKEDHREISISSMVHGRNLLDILLSVVMILVIDGKKAAFMPKPEELCTYWCL